MSTSTLTDAEIVTLGNLESWLTDQFDECTGTFAHERLGLVLASRAALRCAPFSKYAFDLDVGSRPQALLLPVFRALAVSSVFPETEYSKEYFAAHQMAESLYDQLSGRLADDWMKARQAAQDARRSHDACLRDRLDLSAAESYERLAFSNLLFAASRAANCVHLYSLKRPSPYEADITCHRAAMALDDLSSARSYGIFRSRISHLRDNSETLWRSVNIDFQSYLNGVKDEEELISRPLWDGQKEPDWSIEFWHSLRSKLRPFQEEEGWSIWLNWWEGRRDGIHKPSCLEAEIARIPEVDWLKGAKHVNAIITDIQKVHG